jgi:hypothetical protein
VGVVSSQPDPTTFPLFLTCRQLGKMVTTTTIGEHFLENANNNISTFSQSIFSRPISFPYTNKAINELFLPFVLRVLSLSCCCYVVACFHHRTSSIGLFVLLSRVSSSSSMIQFRYFDDGMQQLGRCYCCVCV